MKFLTIGLAALALVEGTLIASKKRCDVDIDARYYPGPQNQVYPFPQPYPYQPYEDDDDCDGPYCDERDSYDSYDDEDSSSSYCQGRGCRDGECDDDNCEGGYCDDSDDGDDASSYYEGGYYDDDDDSYRILPIYPNPREKIYRPPYIRPPYPPKRCGTPTPRPLPRPLRPKVRGGFQGKKPIRKVIKSIKKCNLRPPQYY